MSGTSVTSASIGAALPPNPALFLNQARKNGTQYGMIGPVTSTDPTSSSDLNFFVRITIAQQANEDKHEVYSCEQQAEPALRHARARRPRLHLFSRNHMHGRDACAYISSTWTGETPAPTFSRAYLLAPKSWSNSHCAHHAPGHAFLRTKGK